MSDYNDDKNNNQRVDDAWHDNELSLSCLRDFPTSELHVFVITITTPVESGAINLKTTKKNLLSNCMNEGIHNFRASQKIKQRHKLLPFKMTAPSHGLSSQNIF